MNLGRFKTGVDRSLHRDKVVVTAELIEKGSEIGEGQIYCPIGSSALPP